MGTRPLSHTDLIKMDWLRLLRSENVGPRTFYQLLERFGSAGEALRQLPETTKRLGRTRPLGIPEPEMIAREYASYQRAGAHLIASWEPVYPAWLRACIDAPPLLSIRGRMELFQKPCFGIVGARNGSLAGKKMAEICAHALGSQGFAIVSGLARGIDTAAHTASLPTGTIAILAGGLDHIYPPENKNLYEEIAEKGALVSEMPLGCPPSATLFPRRNRLISGFSWGVLVVEAALKSGSLITARYAGEQGRDVFAVPGHPLDPRSTGTNQLIQDGATLVQKPQDILDVYSQPTAPSTSEKNLNQTEKCHISAEWDATLSEKILKSLTTAPLSIDDIAHGLCLSPALVRAALVEIEIAGYLDRHSGDRVCRKPST